MSPADTLGGGILPCCSLRSVVDARRFCVSSTIAVLCTVSRCCVLRPKLFAWCASWSLLRFAAGTESSDQARDTEAPLKERFYLQAQTPEGALKRAKEAAATLPEIEKYVTKKAWPYVRNELRSEFGYLRFDLTTVANSKSKAEKKALEKEIDDLIASIEDLDYAARVKEPESAKKYFADVSSKLSALLSKLG